MREEYELLGGHRVVAFNSHDEAETYANKNGLLLAEYGDCYGSDVAYAYWNKTGNRYDDEDVIAYYHFGEDGKPEELDEDEFRERIWG